MQENMIDATKDAKKNSAERNDHKAVIVWFTGLSASGKSSTANAVEEKLSAMGRKVIHLDGDQIRRGLSCDLGFSDADRSENIRRIAEVAKIMLAAGQIVLVSAISPFQADRQLVRNAVSKGEFIEVYMNAGLSVCEQRDPKQLYQKARLGLIKKFTGIDSAYEAPQNPDITIDSAKLSLTEACESVITTLITLNVIPTPAV